MLTFFAFYVILGVYVSARAVVKLFEMVQLRQVFPPCRCCNPTRTIALWWSWNVVATVAVGMIAGPVAFSAGAIFAIQSRLRGPF